MPLARRPHSPAAALAASRDSGDEPELQRRFDGVRNPAKVSGRRTSTRRDHLMSTLLWLLLAFVYVALFVTLALTTLRNGHTVLFWVGIFFPVLWIIGALIGPTAGAEARGAA